MKTEIYAHIYNPYTADILYRMRKNHISLNDFLNSDIFASAIGTASEIYTRDIF